MHLEYVDAGPTEVGRSESYEDIEVILSENEDTHEAVVWFVGKVGEEWGEIANMEARPEFGGEMGVASWEGGPQHHTGYKRVRSVFVSQD